MSVPPEARMRKVGAWMRHVAGDFAVVALYLGDARTRIPGYLAGFHAQQAAEKALKGLLIGVGEERFPHSHDIRLLLELIAPHCPWAAELRGAEVLTTFATWGRYPGPWDDPDRAEVEQAADWARRVVESVRRELESRGFDRGVVFPEGAE